jgi:hypothetical protein
MVLVIPAFASSPARPSLDAFRLDEDWSFLSASDNRTDALDRIKYIPVNDDPSSFLSFGGEARDRYEWFSDDLWNGGASDPNGYHLLRLMLHGQARFGAVRVFGELKSNLAEGKSTELRPSDEDRLDLHQAFFEWRSSASGDGWLTRVGRQELNYGSSRIITMREGPNVRQSFDAILARVKTGTWKIDLFYGRPAETRPGQFDDRTNNRQLVYGLYAVKVVPAGGPNFDFYVLGYGRKDARFDQLTGDETRYSVGSRIWGKRGRLDYNFEAVWQWGDIGPASIRAWTVASDTGVALAEKGALRAFLKANAISGDRDPHDSELNTFNALYPRGAYFGDISIVGPANLLNLHPGIGGKLGGKWSYQLDTVAFWRESDGDGAYGASGNLLRSGRNSAARYVGTQADALIGLQASVHWYVELQYAFFWPGEFVTSTGPHSDVAYTSVLTRFRF